jgi:type VI secretion system lysozyme-like protein
MVQMVTLNLKIVRKIMPKRFLERLMDLDLTDDQRRVQKINFKYPELESVKRYLEKVLNTRRGSVLSDPQFGVPDFSSSPGDTNPNSELIGKILIHAIVRYEPRLQDAEIEINIGQDEVIDCRIKGKINENRRLTQVNLGASIQVDGTFQFTKEK